MKTPRILAVGIAGILTLPVSLTAAERIWIGNPGTSDWNDLANWDANGVPVSGFGDTIYVHTTGSISGVALDADRLYMAVGSAADPLSGFTFGAGTYNLGVLFIGEGHIGNGHVSTGPINNAYGNAFINAGTTINVNSFHLGEWDGASGHVTQSGGDVNISNQFRLGHWPQAGGAQNSYALNGGTVTVSGGPANPLNEGSAGLVVLGIDSSGVLTINGGTFTANGLTMQTRGAGGGESKLLLNGGTLNIGVNGLVTSNPTALSSYDIVLKGGTVRATANWSSNLEISLASGGTGAQLDTNAKTVTLSGNLIGAGGLTKIGNGTLKLSGTNSFAGGLTVNTGTVQIGEGGTAGSAGAGAVVVNGGATLAYNRTNALTIGGAVSGTGNLNVNTGTLRLANVGGGLSTTAVSGATLGAAGTFGTVVANSGSTLEAGVGGAGNFSASTLFLFGSTLKVSAGTANTRFNASTLFSSGSNVIQVTPVNLTAGTYTLIDYSGGIGGGGFGSFSLTGLPGRAVGGLVNNVANTSIDLSITAIDNPKWTGAVDGNWDGSTLNWKLAVGGGATNYQNLDAVVFDDSATGTTSVNLTAAFTPSSVLFNNNAQTYTLSGTGGISGGTSVVKQGPGRAIVANTGNDYTGETSIQAGTLQIGDGTAGSLGAGTTVTVGAAGTLELQLPTAGTYTTPTSGLGTVRTIGTSGFVLGAGVLTGAPELNIAGDPSQVIGVNNQSAFNGITNITSGTLRALGAQALGTTTGSTLISSGGTLDVNGLDLGAEQVFVSGDGVLGNGAIVNHGPNTVFNLHKVTLSGDATFGGSARWDIRSSGGGDLLDLAGHKLTKVGGNQVSLVEVNATAGDIDINGGTFSIEDLSQVLAGGTITLNSGGSLGLWVNKPGTLTRQIVANGGQILELGSGQLATVDAPILLQASMSYNVSGGNSVVIHNGNITETGGAYGLSKDGPGRLILRGTNAWTGGFSVNGGVLQVGNGDTSGNLGTGDSTVAGVLVFAKTSSSIIDGDINPGGPAGTMILVADGAVTLASGTDVKLSSLQFGVNGQNDTLGGSLNIGPGTSLTVQDSVIVGNSAGGGAQSFGIFNQTGGTVDVNAPNTDGRNFVLGHWPQGKGAYNLSAGTLNSPNISMAISWDGSGSFTQTGGTADVRGLRFSHNNVLGTYDLTGGTLILGVDGIWAQNAGLPTDLNLGGGTVRAGVNTVITLPVELTGTGSDVTFDTNGNSLVVSGAISGAGGFLKTGEGTMEVVASNTIGGTANVTAGTVQFDASETLGRLIIGPSAVVVLGGPPAPAPALFGEGEIGGDLSANAAQAVPEPGSVVLMLGGIATLLGLRRRRD